MLAQAAGENGSHSVASAEPQLHGVIIKVNLTGPARAPESPGQTLSLEAAAADLVRSQGAYINADDVTPAED